MTQHLRVLTTAAAMCVTLTLPCAAQQPAKERRAPDTDVTENVTKGARLSIDNFGGEVILRTWDKDALKVTARHSTRVKVDRPQHADGGLDFVAEPLGRRSLSITRSLRRHGCP